MTAAETIAALREAASESARAHAEQVAALEKERTDLVRQRDYEWDRRKVAQERASAAEARAEKAERERDEARAHVVGSTAEWNAMRDAVRTAETDLADGLRAANESVQYVQTLAAENKRLTEALLNAGNGVHGHGGGCPRAFVREYADTLREPIDPRPPCNCWLTVLEEIRWRAALAAPRPPEPTERVFGDGSRELRADLLPDSSPEKPKEPPSGGGSARDAIDAAIDNLTACIHGPELRGGSKAVLCAECYGMVLEILRAASYAPAPSPSPQGLSHSMSRTGPPPPPLLRAAWEAGASPSPQGAPGREEIERAARALWAIGNARIGDRPWEQVGHHYLYEAEQALRAASGLPWESVPPAETAATLPQGAPGPFSLESQIEQFRRENPPDNPKPESEVAST